MSVLRRCLPFALFTAPVEVFVRERLLPFLLGLCGACGLAGVLMGLRARKAKR